MFLPLWKPIHPLSEWSICGPWSFIELSACPGLESTHQMDDRLTSRWPEVGVTLGLREIWGSQVGNQAGGEDSAFLAIWCSGPSQNRKAMILNPTWHNWGEDQGKAVPEHLWHLLSSEVLKRVLCTQEEREAKPSGGLLQQSLTKDQEVSMRTKLPWPEPLATAHDSPLDWY